MMINKEFSQYRLKHYNEIDISDQGFFTYLNHVYHGLTNMIHGEILDISQNVNPANRAKFIQISCLFIQEGHTDYEFSNDYSRIVRLMEKPEIVVGEIMNQLNQKKIKIKNELAQGKGTDYKAA